MRLNDLAVFIGYDPAERQAYDVAAHSLRERCGAPDLEVLALDADDLRARGLYRRPTEIRDGRLWDTVSGAAMSTRHANARFFLPLMGEGRWALFTDGDVLFRGDVQDVFAQADPAYAVMCVQHSDYDSGAVKKGGHEQARYARKAWSSFMLWNLEHPAHERLTTEMLNTTPGRDLHRFCWLDDAEIGALPAEWNYLVGVSPRLEDPKLVHYTLGIPTTPGHENDEYADEWRAYARASEEIPA